MITSAQNSMVKWVRHLMASSSARKENNLCVVEGIRLAEEAVAAHWRPDLVFFSQPISHRGQLLIESLVASGVKIEEVHPDLLNRVSDTRQSQGILMVVPIPQSETDKNMDNLLILDNIRDPGNMGTILRSAAALDFHTVILTPGSVDPYSPKVMRAGMGGHFQVAIHTMNPREIHQFCKHTFNHQLTIFLADAENGSTCWESDLKKPLCLIIGGEAGGASSELQAISDEKIHIPMLQKSESFNAAISASILMYETYRQRKMK